MRVIDAAEVEAALGLVAPLVDALRQAFRHGAGGPVRHHHTIPVPAGSDGTLLLMPAWHAGRHIGVKVVTMFPDNASHRLPSVMGCYLLLDGTTGEPQALIDGTALTVKRTAAASALAADYLARPDASRLVMVGTGALAPHLVRAHAAVRPITDVLIWGRTAAKAGHLAQRFEADDFTVAATDDLAGAVRGADVVSCATTATDPVVMGAWLQPGTHVDLVGSFRPDMREVDDAAVRRATLFVDTRDGALAEAGDLCQPIERGVITADDVAADLFELCRGGHGGRASADEITLFKSVGTAIEDLAAAQLTVRHR